jgi:hypothetical protein
MRNSLSWSRSRPDRRDGASHAGCRGPLPKPQRTRAEPFPARCSPGDGGIADVVPVGTMFDPDDHGSAVVLLGSPVDISPRSWKTQHRASLCMFKQFAGA